MQESERGPSTRWRDRGCVVVHTGQSLCHISKQVLRRDAPPFETQGKQVDFLVENLVNHNTPTPMFFVSVDSRGFRFAVSCLESTLVGWLVSVAFKWVRAGTIWRGFSQEGRCGSEFACAVRSWLLLKDRGRAADPLPLQVDVYFHSVGDLDEGYALVHAVVFTVEGHRSSDAA